MAIRFTIPGVFNNPNLPFLDIAGFVDTFTRANASSLGSTEDPARPWTVDPAANVQGITGNEAYAARSGALSTSVAIADAGAADGELSATLGTFTDGWLGLAFRSTGIANGWRFVHSGSLMRLWRSVDGTNTLIDTVTAAPVAGDTISVTMLGANISCYLNGALITSTTDTANQSITSHGFANYGSATNTIRDIKYIA